MPKVFLSPEDRASNTYAPSALWNGRATNEREQMGRCADYLETALKRCGCQVVNAQYGNMYDRVKASNAWPADLHIALHTNGFDGRVAGTRVHCYPSAESRRIGRLVQARIAPLSPGTSERLVESAGLYELRATHMPAVLPEFGFHDNPTEARWLIDSMAQIAEETAQAVCEFFGLPYVPPAVPEEPAVPAESAAPADPAAPEQPADPVRRLYRVQVGAFHSRANAEVLRQQVRAAGFTGAFITEAVID